MPTPSSEKPLLQPARVLMSCHLASNDGALVWFWSQGGTWGNCSQGETRGTVAKGVQLWVTSVPHWEGKGSRRVSPSEETGCVTEQWTPTPWFLLKTPKAAQSHQKVIGAAYQWKESDESFTPKYNDEENNLRFVSSRCQCGRQGVWLPDTIFSFRSKICHSYNVSRPWSASGKNASS